MEKKNWKEVSDKIDLLIKEHYKGNCPKYDGIIDPDKYGNAKYRILWILKEPYDEGNDGREKIRELKDFKCVKTFKRMIYITWSILNNFKLWNGCDNHDEIMIKSLKCAAFINISKLEGETKSPDSRIRRLYKENKVLLLEQIKAFEPNIVVYGGTFKFIRNDLGGTHTGTIGGCKYYTSEKVFWLDIKHPAYWSIPRDTYINEAVLAVESYFSDNPRIKVIEGEFGEKNKEQRNVFIKELSEKLINKIDKSIIPTNHRNGIRMYINDKYYIHLEDSFPNFDDGAFGMWWGVYNEKEGALKIGLKHYGFRESILINYI